MRVGVVGANGQLGSDLVETFAKNHHEVFGLNHDDISIENVDSVQSVLGRIKPQIVLNTAAFHNVLKCEEDPTRSYQVNALGALNLARVASKLDCINVYYSTDYVFDGDKRAPYVETDAPNPLNVYASTKLLGEYYTLNYADKGYVIRVSGLYGKVPCRAKGGNFITTMVRLANERPEVRVVQDEILSPTPTSEIADRTLDVIGSNAYGMFHLTSEGDCSWYEYAKVIFETLKLKTPLHPSSVSDSPIPVKRPFYSVLENSRAKELGLREMPHWKDAAIAFLKKQYGVA